MPTASATIDIQAPSEAVFDLIHDYSRRLEWDPFLREARLIGNAFRAGVAVEARCVARRSLGGLAMETVYVSFNRPQVAAVKMTRGPSFLASFAATLRHDQIDTQTTRVTYRYNFTTRPRCLAFLLNPITQHVFHHETCRRLAALKSFIEPT